MTTKEPSDPDLERGLYAKYRVEKVNGKPVGECFVLEAHDRHAIEALRAYAQSCVNDYPSLSTEQRNAVPVDVNERYEMHTTTTHFR